MMRIISACGGFGWRPALLIAATCGDLCSAEPAAGDSMQGYETAAHSAIGEGMKTPVEIAGMLAHGIGFVLLLGAVVHRIGTEMPLARAVALPVLCAGLGASMQAVAPALGEGMRTIAGEMGYGRESRARLVTLAEGWLPPAGPLRTASTDAVEGRSQGWGARLWDELNSGAGLSQEARAALWRVARADASGELAWWLGAATGVALAAAAVAETLGALVQGPIFDLCIALAPLGWCGLLLGGFARPALRILLQGFAVAVWPVGWALAHLIVEPLARVAGTGLLPAGAEIQPGSLTDLGAVLLPAQWMPTALSAAGSALLLVLAVPCVPALLAWLLESCGARIVPLTRAGGGEVVP